LPSPKDLKSTTCTQAAEEPWLNAPQRVHTPGNCREEDVKKMRGPKRVCKGVLPQYASVHNSRGESVPLKKKLSCQQI
jgi:hypothetical protein